MGEVTRARLVMALEVSEIAFARFVAAHTDGAAFHEEATSDRDLVYTLTGTHAVQANGVLRARLRPAEVGAVVAMVQERFRARRVPCTWWVWPTTQPPDLGNALMKAGFAYRGEGPGMGRDLATLPERAPVPGLAVSHVRDDTSLAAWLRASHRDEADAAEEGEVVLTSQIVLAPDFPGGLLIGTLDGLPVATSMYFGPRGDEAHVEGGAVAAISWVMTVPEARRRGIGASLTLAALRAAREDGYRAAVLMASPLGEPVYRRLGFAEICRIRSYRWAPDEPGLAPS